MTLTPQESEATAAARERFADIEHAAADAEIERKIKNRKNGSVIPVRLPAELYEAVQTAAAQRHLPPSTLIRQWVAQSVGTTGRQHADHAAELERIAAAIRSEHAA